MSLELEGTNSIAWKAGLPDGLTPVEVVFGRDEIGVGEVQVAVATAKAKPTKGMLEVAWKDRGAGSGDPVIVAAEYGTDVWILGPSLEQNMVGPISRVQAELQLQAVLNEPNGIAARKKALQLVNAHNSSGDAGFTNHFLFAAYHLKSNVPRRPDWAEATAAAQPLMSLRGKSLIEGLGFESAPAIGEGGNALVLRAKSGSRRAIAVLLDESEQFDQKSVKYQISPVAHGLEIAGREELPWVIVLRQSTLRLYPGKDGVGVGQRGQSETYFELDLSLVDQGFAGLLPLIFSADALEHGGSAQQILEESGTYAAELGAKLRDRVYEGVVPAISVAIAERLPQLGYAIDADGLKVAYSLTLRILFRLLFQAYGEDTGLLPAGRNEAYDSNSLQSFIKRDANADPSEYSSAATSIWFDLVQVWDAIFNGNERWAVPAYGGSLFDPTTPDGMLLKRLELPDAVMGPALQNLLADVTDEGVRGPVDFRSLQVREFGTIYEGLLESSLSVAESDLTVDKNGSFLPANDGAEVLVPAGRPYFHSAAGDRKATGSYYTPKIVVDHLIERSITPTLETHLAKVRELVDAGKDRDAAELFWDFRVADLAMGSAHFLVAAVDKIERLMRDFLTVTPVPGVRAELERLASKARDALGRDVEAASNINDAQLLRRQVARRCVYGLDINELAVELSRLAIWIHTFVPGLPMSSLDHNLVMGNSLTGIGSIDEAVEALVNAADSKAAKGVKKATTPPADDGLFGGLETGKRESGYQLMLREALNEYLSETKTLLLDAASASEADKSEVLKNAELLAHARQKALPAKRIFDAAVAARLGALTVEVTRPEHVTRLAQDDSAAELTWALSPAHLPLLFPEVFARENPGFSAVIGNPPWEELMVEEPKFWLRVRPGLLGLKPAELKSEIARLRVDRSDLLPELEALKKAVALMRTTLLNGPYPGLGTGDIDLYSAFAWRFWQTLRDGGRLAMVTPRSLLNSAGSESWRKEVLSTSKCEVVTLVNRSEWVFAGVDGRYSVALTCVGKGAPGHDGGSLGLAGPFFSESEFEQGRTDLGEVGFELIRRASSNAAVPNLPSALAAEVFAKLRRSPRLDEVRDGWDFRPVREFDATNDRSTFDAGEQAPGRLPVRGGAGFDIWTPETEEVYAWADPAVVERALFDKRLRQVNLKSSAFYGMQAEWAANPLSLPLHSTRIAFRDVTNATNSRTCIAALIAPETVLTNKAPYVFNRTADLAAEAYLLGVLSSIPLDWYARRYVELGLNLHIFNGLPVPTYDLTNPLVARTALVAGRLAAVDDRYAGWAAEVGVPVGSANDPAVKNNLICELDALVSLLYGLTEDQVEHVFATFHRGWDYQPRLDSVLQHYADWKDKA